MHNAFIFMHILHCLGDLEDNVSTKVLTEVCQANDLVEKLTARAKLQDDVIILTGLGEVNQLDDIGMIQLSHNLNLLKDVCSL